MNTSSDVPTHNAGLVIVVEDEPAVQMLLEEMLLDIGFSPAAFEDAVSALLYLEEHNKHCVLIIADEGLPGGMRGSELIELAHQRWPSIPAILMSGYLISENTAPEGAIFLNKPYNMDQLIDAVGSAIQSKHRIP